MLTPLRRNSIDTPKFTILHTTL